MSKHIYYVSDYAKLDSDVIIGGGSDDTKAIQNLLNKAKTEGRVKIIMDGPALVTGLEIYSNTTIECLDSSCGFFLADGSNCAIFRNANANFDKERKDKNISFLGGTYNHNAKGQEHHVPLKSNEKEIYISEVFEGNKWVMTFEFYGVENVSIKDVTVYNQRTFCLLMANFKFVNIENVNVIITEYMYANNQDGLHFWGPGEFLNLKNITGTAGDDFIALAPDEHDFKSSITDVVIDGITLNNSDQGIRLLSRGEGALDRVLIKNITGTFRGFGFIINPWFDGIGGNFKNIIIDTVALHCTSHNYDYMKPFIFKLGGNIENIVLKNIHYRGEVSHNILQVGGGYMRDSESSSTMPSNIDNVILENVYIYDDKNNTDYIDIKNSVNNFVMKNVQIARKNLGGTLININKDAIVKHLGLSDITCQNLQNIFSENVIKDSIPRVTEYNISTDKD